jgi:hypothetical protein
MMADSISTSTSPPAMGPELLFWAGWAGPYAAGLLQAQRDQFESAILWQQSFEAFYRDLWDRWMAHWGGGAPIDV